MTDFRSHPFSLLWPERSALPDTTGRAPASSAMPDDVESQRSRSHNHDTRRGRQGYRFAHSGNSSGLGVNREDDDVALYHIGAQKQAAVRSNGQVLRPAPQVYAAGGIADSTVLFWSAGVGVCGFVVGSQLLLPLTLQLLLPDLLLPDLLLPDLLLTPHFCFTPGLSLLLFLCNAFTCIFFKNGV